MGSLEKYIIQSCNLIATLQKLLQYELATQLPIFKKILTNEYPSLSSHGNGVLVGYFFKNSKYVYNLTSHLVALEKAKPYPLFQKIPPDSKKKKP